MTTIITLVVLVSLGIVLVDDCIIRDNIYSDWELLQSFIPNSVQLLTSLRCMMRKISEETVNQHLLKSTVTLLLLVEDAQTVIQRRQDGSVDFKQRGWVEYEKKIC